VTLAKGWSFMFFDQLNLIWVSLCISSSSQPNSSTILQDVLWYPKCVRSVFSDQVQIQGFYLPQSTWRKIQILEQFPLVTWNRFELTLASKRNWSTVWNLASAQQIGHSHQSNYSHWQLAQTTNTLNYRCSYSIWITWPAAKKRVIKASCNL